jgi:hypothetical protein
MLLNVPCLNMFSVELMDIEGGETWGYCNAPKCHEEQTN